MIEKNLIIIGGGPAGLSAGLSAYEQGERDILIIEREDLLGGILNQCIHNGFGLHTFREELTGPEYASRYIEIVKEVGIETLCQTTVIGIDKDKVITCVSQNNGLQKYKAKAIILACGCRERPRGGINIAGNRVAGIFSAGTAQKLINIDGYKIGKEVVILGSGDIGLIMARRMTFEGAKVKAVVELMPYSSGLNRNIVQCLNDFDIPLLFSHTIVDIKGDGRVSSVVIAPVNEKLQPDLSQAQEISCDTLLLSVGLLPENELSKMANIELDKTTGGAVVDDNLMTSVDGIFQCGNILHVHDLVDFVSKESAQAGKNAVEYIKNGYQKQDCTAVQATNGVRYVVPQKIVRNNNEQDIELKMRVGKVVKNVAISVIADGKEIASKKRPIVAPGEMENIVIKGDAVKSLRSAQEIVVCLKEA